MSSIWTVTLVVALGALVLRSEAQITLSDNNSVAKLDPTTQAGMFYWAVQIAPNSFQNQLNQQWFWYRLDGNPEKSIDTISAPVISGLTANSVTTTYNDSLGRFNVAVSYQLHGGLPSSGTADITESITINNTSGTVLPYHFFQYSDFNLGGSGANDTVLLSRNGFTGRVNQSDQFTGANLVETVVSPNANHGEADYVFSTRNKLNDALPTTLDDSKTTAGPGDVAWGLQWDVDIGVNGSFIISKDKHLNVVVPEPSALALVSMGLLAWTFRRRRL